MPETGEDTQISEAEAVLLIQEALERMTIRLDLSLERVRRALARIEAVETQRR